MQLNVKFEPLHPYFADRGVIGINAFTDDKNNIYIPLVDIDDNVQGYEKIYRYSNKYLHKSSTDRRDVFAILKSPKENDIIIITTDYRSTLSIYANQNKSADVVCVFSPYDLREISNKIRLKHKTKRVVIITDNTELSIAQGAIAKAPEHYIIPNEIKHKRERRTTTSDIAEAKKIGIEIELPCVIINANDYYMLGGDLKKWMETKKL